METTDQDDTEEIFQECSNTDFIKSECNESLDDLNLANVKNKKQKVKLVDFGNYEQNNNHHVVPVGVIVVFITIYLGMTSVQKCLVDCVENTQITEQVQQNKKDILNYLQKSENLENSQILERLLEYKDICKDLEVFTKDIEPKPQDNKEDEEDNVDVNLKGSEVSGAGSGEEEEQGSSVDGIESSSSGASGNGDCGKVSRNKHKKSKYSIKTTNSKNGFNKYNKSTKAKYQKKELNLNKKNSTAEPIIYLFALVFIYLLLKAASDINQHYKSQNKNDKRLRRCSLQSYAQIHRPDRRASKEFKHTKNTTTTELALKQKQQLQQQQQQQRLITLSRSLSQDQQNYPYSSHYHQQQQHLMMDSSPQTTEQQQHAVTAAGSSSRTNVSYASNWQLLRQHTTTQSLDNSDLLNCARGNSEISSSSMMTRRRCSVPAALGYQRQKFSAVSPLSIANDHVNVSLSRRTSIITPITLAMDPNDSLSSETKRRVRMINRH